MPRPRLPYGLWTNHDGSEVLFDRGYRALSRRWPGHPAAVVSPYLHVRWTSQEFFYRDDEDWTPELVERLEWLVHEFSVGLDVRPYLIEEQAKVRAKELQEQRRLREQHRGRAAAAAR